MAAKISSRSVRVRSLEAAKKHTAIQGEVVNAANILHEAFYHLFSIVLALERSDAFAAVIRFHDHALAIWHVIQSDSSQRDMAMAALSTVPTALNLAPALRRLKWAKDKADKLAGYRNIVAHNPVMFRGRTKGKRIESVPSFGGHATRPVHKRRLDALKDDLAFWRTLRNDLLDLGEYVQAINDQIQRVDAEGHGAQLVGVPSSWPDRPRLRSVPRLQALDRTLRPAPHPPKRRSRRRPSRK